MHTTYISIKNLIHKNTELHKGMNMKMKRRLCNPSRSGGKADCLKNNHKSIYKFPTKSVYQTVL